MRARLVVIGTVALFGSSSAFGHHSISAHYDRGRSVTIAGVVIEFLLRNPHSEIRMTVEDESGATTVWTLEMDDADDIIDQGIAADTIRAGDVVIATGNPARDGSDGLFVRTMTRPADGLEYLDD
ncbi:MAG TPA: DUF6152 family protein [Gammaproteobacteria bacterium]|nr:DUF6152 family protein [Gammaproteobacteria bacterium]